MLRNRRRIIPAHGAQTVKQSPGDGGHSRPGKSHASSGAGPILTCVRGNANGVFDSVPRAGASRFLATGRRSNPNGIPTAAQGWCARTCLGFGIRAGVQPQRGCGQRGPNPGWGWAARRESPQGSPPGRATLGVAASAPLGRQESELRPCSAGRNVTSLRARASAARRGAREPCLCCRGSIGSNPAGNRIS
jgi:hypothetical protein